MKNVFLSPRTKAEEVTRRETRERPGQTTRLLLMHDEISISLRSNTNEQLGRVWTNEFARI